MRHIGKVNFVLLFGIIISIPLLINYYLFKILISLVSFLFFSWEYSLTELVLVQSLVFCWGSYLVFMFRVRGW